MSSSYDDVAGVKGAVENEQYCMPSMQKRNVDSMNQMMGYHNMSDLANTPKYPTKMTAATSHRQLGPELPNPSHNDQL